MTADHLWDALPLWAGYFDTFDGAKARFLNWGLAPLSINPEHTRDFRPGESKG